MGQTQPYRALVLGGGGARGALQVGAIRAFLESGYTFDLLVGTSAGAINATCLALYGLSLQGLDRLEELWYRAAQMELLPPDYIWTTLRSILRRSTLQPARNIGDFLVASGVEPSLRFSDLLQQRLIIVSADLNTGRPVLHGESPQDYVLDALLVSTALPPWAMPIRKQGRYLMDGAVVSSLPVEPALRAGATEIVALDLADPREPFGQVNDFGIFVNQLTHAVETRQVDLELALAQARGVPVFYLSLTSDELVHIWDFKHTQSLIPLGYQLARNALDRAARLDAGLRTRV